MLSLSKYWKLWKIDPSDASVGYKSLTSGMAQEFLLQEFGQLDDLEVEKLKPDRIQASLLSSFYFDKSDLNLAKRARAGLCLRCYVSYPILNACKKLASLFNSGYLFTYRDLLPYVLNDDGRTLIILDERARTQLVLDGQEQVQPSSYPLFTVEILRTYNPRMKSPMSLENWAYWQTKRQPQVKNFLAEFGFKHLSDWALLNRIKVRQLEALLPRERCLVNAYHAVYRRDRIQQPHQKAKKCPKPSETQLKEMLGILKEQEIRLQNPQQLLEQLQQIANSLRQYEVWSHRGTPLTQSLDIFDPIQGDSVTQEISDPKSNVDLELLERQEFLAFLQEQFDQVLQQAIATGIEQRLVMLRNSNHYRKFVARFIPGLQYYYFQSLSLKQIAPLLDMSSRDQTRRILNPGELVNSVRTHAVQSLLNIVLIKAKALGLTEIPPRPDYLRNLIEQVEAFVDEVTFTKAAAEIQRGTDRSLSSIYAQHLRRYLSQHSPGALS